MHEIGLGLVDCGIDTECHASPTVTFLSAVEPYKLCQLCYIAGLR